VERGCVGKVGVRGGRGGAGVEEGGGRGNLWAKNLGGRGSRLIQKRAWGGGVGGESRSGLSLGGKK